MHVLVGLKPHPELWRGFQQAAKSDRGIRSDAALAQHDLVQAVERDLEPTGGLDLAQSERLQKLLLHQPLLPFGLMSAPWPAVNVAFSLAKAA